MNPLTRKLITILPALLFGNVLMAQSSLSLSSLTVAAGSPVSLDLALGTGTGTQPAAIQWTFTYPAASVQALVVTAGPALTAAGKTLTCAGSSTAYICIGSGINANVISSGVVA